MIIALLQTYDQQGEYNQQGYGEYYNQTGYDQSGYYSNGQYYDGSNYDQNYDYSSYYGQSTAGSTATTSGTTTATAVANKQSMFLFIENYLKMYILSLVVKNSSPKYKKRT